MDVDWEDWEEIPISSACLKALTGRKMNSSVNPRPWCRHELLSVDIGQPVKTEGRQMSTLPHILSFSLSHTSLEIVTTFSTTVYLPNNCSQLHHRTTSIPCTLKVNAIHCWHSIEMHFADFRTCLRTLLVEYPGRLQAKQQEVLNWLWRL